MKALTVPRLEARLLGHLRHDAARPGRRCDREVRYGTRVEVQPVVIPSNASWGHALAIAHQTGETADEVMARLVAEMNCGDGR